MNDYLFAGDQLEFMRKTNGWLRRNAEESARLEREKKRDSRAENILQPEQEKQNG